MNHLGYDELGAPALCPHSPGALVIAAAPFALQAQGQKFEGKDVVNIQFDPARQPLEPEELSEILPLKMHAPLRMADVRASIDRLFATGRYADIQVDVKPFGDGVAVTFVTKNSWFIGDVSIAGNISSPPNPGQLGNSSRMDLGAPYSDARLQDAVTGQRSLLESNGLYGAQIAPTLDFETDADFQQVNSTVPRG